MAGHCPVGRGWRHLLSGDINDTRKNMDMDMVDVDTVDMDIMDTVDFFFEGEYFSVVNIFPG